MALSVYMDLAPLAPTAELASVNPAAPRSHSLYSPEQMLELLARAELRRRRYQYAMQSLPIVPEQGVMPEPSVQPVQPAPFVRPVAPARPNSLWNPFVEP